MEIKIAKFSGYCYGVKRAMDLALEKLDETSEKKVYSLGPLIHNDQAMKKFTDKGLIVEEDINKKKEGIQELESNLKIAQDKVKTLEKEYAGYPKKADLDSSLLDVNRMLLKQEHSIEQIKKYIEQRNQYFPGLIEYLPDATSGNRDIGSIDSNGYMRFGNKHNDIYPIIADMIRWKLNLPNRHKKI